MWIEEIQNSKGKKVYKYCDRYFDPKTRTRKKVSVTMANKARDTRKEAQILLDEKIDQRLNQKQLRNIDLTFYDLIDEWMPYYKKQVKEATYVTTKYAFNTFKNNLPYNWLVSTITPTDLVEVLEKLLYSENLANNYISMMKGKLNKLFSYAAKHHYIETNPIPQVVVERKRDERSGKIKDKFLEDDEYKRLVEYVDQHNKRYSLLFQWLYYTGMRPGEALALDKDDVYKKSDETYHVNISGTMLDKRRVKYMKKSNSTKSNAGMREIDIPENAITIYKELIELNPNGHFLFQTSKGTPFLNSSLNTYLRNHKAKMRIDKPVSLHIFRHTHISKLAELGVPLYVIQDRVGHEHSGITEKIYTHVTKNAKKVLKDNLEKL